MVSFYETVFLSFVETISDTETTAINNNYKILKQRYLEIKKILS